MITVTLDLASVYLLHFYSILCHVVFFISKGEKIADEVNWSEEQVDGEELQKKNSLK